MLKTHVKREKVNGYLRRLETISDQFNQCDSHLDPAIVLKTPMERKREAGDDE